VLTPPLSNALPGITRRAVMEVLADIGYPCKETDMRREDLDGVDEAFYTSSLARIQPIRSIEGQSLRTRCPGPATLRLQEAMTGVYAGKNAKFNRWLTPIK